MSFFDIFRPRIPVKHGPPPMAPKEMNQQAFVPGPGPAPGSHSTQYHAYPQHRSPRFPLHSMARAYGGQQSLVTPIGVDDNQYHATGFNNNGVGQLVNAQAAVQQIPVLQWSNALAAPSRDRNGGLNPTRGENQGERLPELNMQAPIRPQSIPGYVVSQYQVTNSGINASQVQLYRNLRAPKLNESQSSMC